MACDAMSNESSRSQEDLPQFSRKCWGKKKKHTLHIGINKFIIDENNFTLDYLIQDTFCSGNIIL